MLRLRAQPVPLTALAQLGLRPRLVGGDDLDLRVAHHPDRAAARRDPRCSAPARSRSPSCAGSTSARRSCSGSWRAPGSTACAGGRSSSGPISGGPCCSARCRSRSRSASCRSPQLLIVSGLAAILTTFFDAADNAYLPTIVERERLVDANSALAASGSAAEFMAFGISGFLVQILTAPIAIAVDAVTYLASALLLGTIRHAGAAAAEARGPRSGRDRDPGRPRASSGTIPILRAFVGAQMALAALWGVFGATLFLFVLDDLGLSPAVLGVVAGVGGASSFIGAVVATRTTGRWGIGPVAIGAMLLAAVGQRVHPARAVGPAARRRRVPRHAAAHRRLGGHGLRHHRGVGPPDARRRPGARTGRLDVQGRRDARPARGDARWPGILAEAIGLRATSWLAPVGGLVARRRSCGSRRSGTCSCCRPPSGADADAARPARGRGRTPRWTSRPAPSDAVRRTAPPRTRRGRTG